MIRLILISISITVVFGCGNPTNKDNIPDLPTVSIENQQYYAPYCIYLLEDDSIGTSEIKNLVSSQLTTYTFADSLSEETGINEYIIKQFGDPVNEHPAPNLEYLQHSAHGLSNEEMNQLQSPFNAVLIVFSGSNKDVIADQIKINGLIDSLLKDRNAVVTDYTTYESFNHSSWNSRRVSNFNTANLDITSQYTIHTYRENEFCRAVTLGLGKFCLPDISVQNISCNNQRVYGSLINLISQTWIENPTIRIDSTLIADIDSIKNDSVRINLLNSLEQNAKKRALIKLAFVEPQEGDAYNAQIEIIFNDKNFNSKQEEQQALITQLFGASDEIEYIDHDKEILEASQRAKAKLPALKEMFNQGLEPGFSLLLKAPFETDNGGNEWMWVEVTAWENDSIKGILQNDPYEISDLSVGAIVSFDQSEVFDYILYHPDGSTEGNETGEIISRGQ